MKGQICDKLKKTHCLKKLSQCHAETDQPHRIMHELGFLADTNFFTKTEDGFVTICLNQDLYDESE